MVILFPERVSAQQQNVSGIVTSAEDGAPLPGVSITEKGLANGTMTDADGVFTLSVKGNAVLVFSFVGLETTEINVQGQSHVNVSLKSDTRQLEEVVITGLATSVKRSNLANAVATLSGEELVGRTRPATVDAAMNGKIIGANISQNSGAPGGGVSIKLRGISSINGSSDPLFIIDGVFINNSQLRSGAGTEAFSGADGTQSGAQDQATNRLSDINPADIENIEILKGPSAAAIYGTRANAGVVIITTKKGKSGKTSVNLSQDIGFSSAIKLLGSSDWSEEKIRQFGRNGGITNVGLEDALALYRASEGRTYDYEKVIYGNTGKISNTRLSVSGGNEKTNFLASANVNDETGIQKRTGFQRRSIRLNLNHKLSNNVDFSTGSNYINSGNQRGFSGNDNNGVAMGYSLAYLPNFINLDPEDGVYPENPINGQNPLQITDKAVNDESTNRFIQSLNMNINLLSKESLALKFVLSGGVDYFNTEGTVYMPDFLQYQQQRANPGASRLTDSRNLNANVQGLFVLNASVGKIELTSQAGAVRLITDREISWIQGEGLAPNQKNPQTGAIRSFNHRYERWQDVGLILQQEANYDDKVIGSVGIRFDKSSLNGDHEKWYAFPRASLAVNIAKFDFWRIAAVSQLKLRGAFGQTGGVPVYGNTFTSLTSAVIDGTLGSLPPNGSVSAPVGNPALEPETAQEIELGVDVGVLDNKILLEATYYDKDVFDLIQAYTLASGTGVTSIAAFPVGDLQNKGIELGLNASIVQRSAFSWNTQVSYWFNRSEITRLIIPPTAVGTGFSAFGRNRLVLGESPTRWYGTPNVDGQPTTYGDAQPKYQVSFANQFTFLNGFELSFLFHTSQGNYNSNLTRLLKDEGGTSKDWADDDDGDGIPNGKDERLFGAAGNNSGYFINDASYIRLREVSLFYNLPKEWISKTFGNAIENIRLGASGNNLLTITDYPGYDPESSNFGNQSVGANVDVASYPNSKRVFFHIAFDF
jgi:TonB-linked SusC/RagA family outer membrane protein